MILTSLPDLPPRPETAVNAAFRRWYTPRWGRENALVCGVATLAEYPLHTQTLSIKTAWSGQERYFLPRREVVVDDDNYLILNEGRTYASRLATRRPTGSFSVFFRPRMQDEVCAARAQRLAGALDDPAAAPRTASFGEHLRRHDATVSCRLRRLRDAALAGERDEDWLEQQLLLLLDAMLDAEALERRRDERLSAVRPATRRELARCALRETWSGRGGFAGISLNAWDRDDRRWHQSWFDTQGGRLELAGQRVGDAMQLGSATPHPDKPGATRRQRSSWTPLPDGAVRQLWETSDDDGASWRVVFDGRYVKRR